MNFPKPEFKVENGIVTVKVMLEQAFDKDVDGKKSATIKLGADIELDAYELVTEIAKKDYAFLELILKQVKV